MNLQLREYQKKACRAVVSDWGLNGSSTEEPVRTTLLNLATSSGKTHIAGALIHYCRKRGRCLFLADTDVLCGQPRKKFAAMGMSAGLEKAENRCNPEDDIVIGSAQTLQRQTRLERFPPDHFSFIFVDEAHRGSPRNKKITDYFSQARVVGMTGTAMRGRLKDLSDYYEKVSFELGFFDLIAEGYAPPIKVLTLPVEIDVRGTQKEVGKEYDEQKVADRIEPYYHRIAEMIQEHAPKRQIIAFLPLIASSKQFVAICREHGINAEHIDGTFAPEDRDARLSAFERKEFQLLSNSSLLTTGWDCPTVDCLLNLSPGRSVVLYRQKVGRIIRVLPDIVDGIEYAEDRKKAISLSDKPDSLIMDLLWQTEAFGLQGPADLVAQNESEKEAINEEVRKARTVQDLLNITTAVQEARESALRKALERAKQFIGAAIASVGAVLRSPGLVEYEPVMHWEEKPVSDKQAEFLRKQGIDPKTARGRGHASKLMSLLFRRKEAGLAPWRVVSALDAAGKPNAWQWTDENAYQELGDDYPFPFGTHVGEPFGTIPQGYWAWLSEQAWVENAWPIVWKHMAAMGLVVEPLNQKKGDSGPGMFDVLED